MELSWHPAPGKLNLFLHVLGRRADGYHELQTVFRLIDRCDRVGIAVREDGEVRFSGVFGEENLCLKAARLLKKESGTRLGCELQLEKTLPAGGGLGGGSSDAATVLLVLNKVWNLALNRQRLQRIGLALGADVPFFLFGKNALGEGIGERLKALELGPAWYLVLTPQVAVSTKEIFTDGALTRDTKRLTIPPFFSGQGANDLEPVVCARYPEVAAQLAWLRQRCPQARMTGSGACVFAEFHTKAEALAVQSKLPGGMGGFVAQGLERHPLHDWAD
ncbi:MAG TPA: 4-(cytidine 5'-diphospho)-2-C-methyl-D-erythritol kinase [Burkholderiales bacterium]|jgi:4-diphosphocytidyl-2-C-methyl-D-erythritol kinase|nr:4-(cytidine 5'-diphospho)-2-C-methyl-D-erythritol kinase [Burkholderiales bacterium]